MQLTGLCFVFRLYSLQDAYNIPNQGGGEDGRYA